MSWAYPHLPRNAIATTVVLITLILSGGGLISWNNARIITDYQQGLKHRNPRVRRTPRTLSTEALRYREKIYVFQDTPDPLPIMPSERSHLIHHIPTDQKVVFITIDDGLTKDQKTAKYMAARKLPITAFLTIDSIKDDFPFFSSLAQHNTVIENHTVGHPVMPKLPYEKQKEEICHSSESLHLLYGRRPQLFRPPYGEYNDDTLRAAAACGIKATVLWSAVMQGGTLHYQTPATSLKPGDIILLHYKPELQQDLELLIRSIHEQGFQIGQLEDWIR